MKLSCVLTCNGSRGAKFPGVTANMHRDGMLICCDSTDIQNSALNVGDRCEVEVELPPNPDFSRKSIVCETVLVRIEPPSDGRIHVAMRITKVAFRNLKFSALHLAQMKSCETTLPV